MSEHRRTTELAPHRAAVSTFRRALPSGGQRSLVIQQAAERALAVGGGAPLPKRPLRVPTEALVSLAPPAFQNRSPLGLPPPTNTANDNEAPTRTGRVRQAVREAIFLVLLAVTIAAAFYTGRQNGSQNVIVVPGPLSFYAAVT